MLHLVLLIIIITVSIDHSINDVSLFFPLTNVFLTFHFLTITFLEVFCLFVISSDHDDYYFFDDYHN